MNLNVYIHNPLCLQRADNYSTCTCIYIYIQALRMPSSIIKN